MKILKLRLVNIKCFKEVEIPFESVDGGARNWSLLVGDNGQGKTTILRSLAMGLCDDDWAASLLSELDGFLRWKKKEGSIEVCLGDSNGKKYTIRTRIKREGDKESISNQDVFQGDCVGECDGKNGKSRIKNFKKRKDIFAVAYGAGRSVMGTTESHEEYTLVDALYTLFKYERPLQKAELCARRIQGHPGEEWENLQDALKKILMMEEEDEISLKIKGLYFKTSRGEGAFDTMSDGYKSLTSVVMDFLGWNRLYKFEDFSLKDLSGIFIIDELEQHLHPRWQRKIIKTLSDQFPKMQFICSTHTPICALGLTDLVECESRLFKVAYVNGHSEVEEFDIRKEFKGYRSDQILTSRIFGLTDTRSDYIEKRLERYAEIYLVEKDERDPEEEELLQEIEEELKGLPMWDNAQEKIQRAELIELLKNQTDES